MCLDRSLGSLLFLYLAVSLWPGPFYGRYEPTLIHHKSKSVSNQHPPETSIISISWVWAEIKASIMSISRGSGRPGR